MKIMYVGFNWSYSCPRLNWFISTCPEDSPDTAEGGSSKISDGLKELLKYMNNTKDYPVESTQYDLIKKIDEAVAHAKRDEEWSISTL